MSQAISIEMTETKMWHGTAGALGLMIEKEGLNPEGCTIVPKEFRKSCYSQPGYVYFYDDLELAKDFACGMAFKVGIGKKGQVFEIDTKEVEVEPDPLLPAHSWRHKGFISPDKIKSVLLFDCSQQIMKEFAEEFKREREKMGLTEVI